MSEGKVEFRRARTGDIEAAIPLLYSSGPAVFDFIFKHAGHTSQDFLRYTLSDGAGELGYRNHVVGEMDGKVIAIGAAFGGETTLPFFLSAARQIASFYGTACLPVVRHGLQVEGVIQPPRGRLHYIAHLGVDPALQSQGIGTKLVEHLIQQGRAQGKTLTALDVSVLNPRAQALYERLGFKLSSQHRSEIQEVPSHNRLERTL